MTKKIRKPLSIILSLMMILSVFTIIPTTANAFVTGESTFYVVGSFTDWQTDAGYILTENPEARGEYYLSGVDLHKDDEFKVVEENDSIQDFEPVWYPAGFDNSYIVSADGTYDIYFRPNYDGGDDWHYNCIYAADVTPEPETYTVTWKNWDGTELEKDENVEEGTIPTYDGAAPTKPADGDTAYEFAGWDPEVTAVTGDAVYTATFSVKEISEVETSETVTLYFTNNMYWGSVNAYIWKEGGDEYAGWPGVAADYVGKNDFGEGVYSITIDTNDYAYVLFNGTGGITVDINVNEAVAGGGGIYCLDTMDESGHYDVGFYEYIAPTTTYTVIWKNWDGTELEKDENVEEGAIPTYDGEEPTRPEDDEYTYEFAGWDPEIAEVTGDAEYTAQFTPVPKDEPIVGESTFYVVGSFSDWQTDDAYVMTKNAEAEGEYYLFGAELNKDDEFKIVETNGSVLGFQPVWYPAGYDNNYVVPADGIYDIYFRPNYDGGEDWYFNCIYVADVIPAELENTSSVDNEAVPAGSKVTITGSAKGGSPDYTYAYFYKLSTKNSWNKISDGFVSDTSQTLKLGKVGDYDIKVIVKDSDGCTIEKLLKVTAIGPVVNNSTLSEDETFIGSDVSINAAATGGSGEYTYAYFYKLSTKNSWNKLSDGFVSDTSMSLKQGKVGEYDVRVIAKDSAGKTKDKVMKLTVKKLLENTTTISDDEIALKSWVYIAASAEGISGEYTFAYLYKMSSKNTWNKLSDGFVSDTSMSLKLGKAGDFDIRVIAKDGDGRTDEKRFVVMVI